MIVGGQTSARALTIIDYHAPFDQGLRHNTTLKAKRNYIFARFLYWNDCKLIPCTLNNGYSDAPIKKISRVILFKVHADN